MLIIPWDRIGVTVAVLSKETLERVRELGVALPFLEWPVEALDLGCISLHGSRDLLRDDVDRRFAGAGLLVVGYAANGDPVVVDLETGKAGYGNHEDASADVPRVSFVAEFDQFLLDAATVDDERFPADYWDARDREKESFGVLNIREAMSVPNVNERAELLCGRLDALEPPVSEALFPILLELADDPSVEIAASAKAAMAASGRAVFAEKLREAILTGSELPRIAVIERLCAIERTLVEESLRIAMVDALAQIIGDEPAAAYALANIDPDRAVALFTSAEWLNGSLERAGWAMQTLNRVGMLVQAGQARRVLIRAEGDRSEAGRFAFAEALIALARNGHHDVEEFCARAAVEHSRVRDAVQEARLLAAGLSEEQVRRKAARSGQDSLSVSERRAFAWYDLRDRVMSGGFRDYFRHASAESVALAAQVLERAGAESRSRLLDSAARVVAEGDWSPEVEGRLEVLTDGFRGACDGRDEEVKGAILDGA